MNSIPSPRGVILFGRRQYHIQRRDPLPTRGDTVLRSRCWGLLQRCADGLDLEILKVLFNEPGDYFCERSTSAA